MERRRLRERANCALRDHEAADRAREQDTAARREARAALPDR